MERKIIDLGWSIAIVQKTNPMLKIVRPGDTNPDTYVSYPAQNVEIWSRKNIEKLRDGLNEVLEQEPT